jgi:hypothetical protein
VIRLALVAVVLLAGCAAEPIIGRLPPPPEAGCADQCDVACDAFGIAYAPSESDAIGELVEQVIIPMRARIDQCELSRRACAQCINRLKIVGAVR